MTAATDRPTTPEEHARVWWRALDRRQSEMIGELFARVEGLERLTSSLSFSLRELERQVAELKEASNGTDRRSH